MRVEGKVVVVTGAGRGIGRALARRFAAEGAKGVAVGDVDGDGAEAVAAEITAAGGAALGLRTDVAVERDVRALVEAAETAFGPVDLCCSNAGIAIGGGVEASDEDWQRIWDVNLMAHVYAARAVLPSMIDRGEGYLLNTASAAGLLTNLGAAPYSVTKHAAVALAEWLAITHGDEGIKVSVLCPQGVNTAMLMGDANPGARSGDETAAEVVKASGRVLEPEEVAEAVVRGLAEERFLILPHPEVAEYWHRKADDPDRWLAGMRRLQARLRSLG
jgi:NAD(P)-dependent dehydrogenase (short-subunit alcohol dehydrogenase family)